MSTDLVPLIGPVPSLETVFLGDQQAKDSLTVKSWAPYNRFAVQIADNGLDSFGLREGNYAIFREARWPDRECQICLVRFAEEVTVRLVEGIRSDLVNLRVSGDRIPPVELAPTDFSVVGILDGVIFQEFAGLVPVETDDFDWGA
ncbi:hypothetical protein [Alicyclobacillus sp. ALC3]|uniref:hypothetical protein n=1 Tax=Alicyclobacillus sp. ALC3 TaxID=2796143 RepID=UPI0023782B33|nr:hypothetical protein [Alicyclobacillus sp. ALC3]WDL96368.1 hypothetical protein JC200_18890 [Alicyclobacillus sp. ALC3]